AQISAASHAPFIAGAAPALLGMDSWQQLANPRDLAKIFGAPDYAAWRSLRESEDAKYVGLAMPRFLARLP
ncbi:type VI secretion system contractile sheath domain-containing protein, partial [Escherichia coli]|uniref:type VI secretion system contractile sheath domain-containing protein n=1 Tax=Escherichia coli TaxID=562 RepID=UPI003CECCFF2